MNATREVVMSLDRQLLWMMIAKEQISQYGLYFLSFLCLKVVQCNGISLTVAQTTDFLDI